MSRAATAWEKEQPAPRALELPRFIPRSYQHRGASAIVCAGLNKPWIGGKEAPRRILLRYPRQCGKDRLTLNAVAQICRQRSINVYYGFPEYAHARRSLWENIDALTGQRMLDDVLPFAHPNHAEMTLTFHETGAIIRMVGWDNYLSLPGTGAFVFVWSEAARCDPRSEPYFTPVIKRNGGVEIFITTAFGGPNNWGAVMARTFNETPGCFAETLNIEQCFKDAGWVGGVNKLHLPGEDGSRVITENDVQAERALFQRSMGRFGMSEEMIQQEWYNSDAGVSEGTIFGAALSKADANGQFFDSLPVNKGAPVFTFWDLGRTDATAVWFAQQHGPWWNIIDYLEATNSDIDWWAGTLAEKARERGYVYGAHQWPHDGKQKHFGPSDTREQVGRRLINPPPRIAEKATSFEDQKNAGRAMFSRIRMDRTRCAVGLECLRNWHQPWDAKNKVFGVMPVHDWSSHGGSAWCTFALYAQNIVSASQQPRLKMAHEI